MMSSRSNTNNDSEAESLHAQQMLYAINLYTNESPILIKNCMLQAGFVNSDTQESGLLYTFFLGTALDYDFERLKLLKRPSRPDGNENEIESRSFSPNIDTNIGTSLKLEMVKKALNRYKYESCYTLVKCMLKAGLEPSKTYMCDPAYHICLQNVLECETIRWRHLRSSFRKARKNNVEKNK